MSNVQVHCEHCNTSLYRMVSGSATRPPSVRIYTDDGNSFRDRVIDDTSHEFCGWTCVGQWAFAKTHTITSAEASA